MPRGAGLAFLLFALAVHPAPAAPSRPGPVTEVLPNGLTVVAAEMRGSDVVTINAWVKVGSRDETDEMTGAAHFVEHLLFKGTRRRAPGAMSREVERIGGQLNASTSFDFTQYYIVAPGRFFDPLLDLQADALMHSTFDPAEVERERTVVLQELALVDDSPARSAYIQLYAVLYPTHPYRRPVGGRRESVGRMTRDALYDFYRAHYGPANVTLIVTGSIAPGEAVAGARRALGGWRRPVRPRAPVPVDAPPAEVRRVAVERDVRTATILLGWIGAEVRNPDHYALDVLAVILGRGRAARLTRSLRDRQQLVQSVGAGFGTSLDPGLFVISATADPAQAGRVEQAVLAELAAVQADGVTDEEMERAKTLIEMETRVGQHTSRGYAVALGYAATIATLDYHATYLDRIAAVTREDVRRVAARYLDPRRYAIVTVGPPRR